MQDNKRMTDNILEFIEVTLRELSNEYNIPKDMIPHLIVLLEQYPDTTIHGKKKALRDGLERQIDSIKNQGFLD